MEKTWKGPSNGGSFNHRHSVEKPSGVAGQVWVKSGRDSTV